MALLRTDRTIASRPTRYSEAARHLSRKDPILRELIQRLGPCQLRPRRNHFATLCDSIISQQLSAKAAQTICDRFAAIYALQRPTPTEVAKTARARLRAAGLSSQKTRYVKDLAARFVHARLVPNRFARQPNEEIITSLCSVKGIGQWTAEMFLIFALNRLDVLPVGDLGIQKAVMRWYELSKLPTPSKLKAIAKPWHPYESVACWYLWHSLRL
ncbi:MAG: hypothetical protein V3R16_08060 [Nitrospirales bacterium]